MKVLVIPEDPTNNGYLLKPLVQRILEEVGKPNAFVQILTTPRIQGYSDAKQRIPEIAARYRHMDLLLFLPDRDCSDKTAELKHLEDIAARCGATLITCAAVEEVETWLLAGHVDDLTADWRIVRSECSVKEIYFEPFLTRHGDSGPGQGRTRLMYGTLRNFSGLLARCPELKELQDRIRIFLNT